MADADGRGERIRTFDPLVPNQMRYQTALRPDELRIVACASDSNACATVPCMDTHITLPWLGSGDPFPTPDTAWGDDSPAPGLLACGDTLDAPMLERAYRNGIFPWFNHDQPVLWWSPDPRMVLRTGNFVVHHALRKTLRTFIRNSRCEVVMDRGFDAVISACASAPRQNQNGTWIVPSIRNAYGALHDAGMAHSVEVWKDDQLVGGLYCVSIGQAVFGESMFTVQRDASKIALAALVAFCRAHGMPFIDCQQNTQHLAFLGACEMPRRQFLDLVGQTAPRPAPTWRFDPVMWRTVLESRGMPEDE